jgi:glutamine amidotransferase
MSSHVAILDYGSGNVRSMLNALTKVARDDQRVTLTADPAVIADAERVVVPGVGAFAEVRRKLDASGLRVVLETLKAQGRPVLGVCVGMQMMADQGLEFGTTPGLSWVGGVVSPLEPPKGLKLPHIGWSAVTPRRVVPLFDGIALDAHFYFVHSFAFRCAIEEDVLATAEHGVTFTAAIGRGNVVGTQFHPEKSDAAGLKLLGNFCRWSPP